MNADIRLVVVTASDAFSEFWAGIAERLSLTLELNETPQPVRDSRTAAVILACGGTERHAVDLLHAATGMGRGRGSSLHSRLSTSLQHLLGQDQDEERVPR